MKDETSARKKTIKRWLGNIGIALLSILLCCIVAECVIRFLAIDRMTLYPPHHTDVQYGEYKIRRLTPNLEYWHTDASGSWKFTINKQGYRSKYDFSYDKPPGVVRVIALGDSHTQEDEVRQDYTFSAIAEKYLSSYGREAQVLNMGGSGFGTAKEATDYSIELPSRLVERMHSSCMKNNIKLIIAGITWPGGIIPPWPDEMKETMVANCDVSVDSGNVLKDYDKLIPLHKEHGQYRISEFTHCLLDAKIAKEMISEETSQ